MRRLGPEGTSENSPTFQRWVGVCFEYCLCPEGTAAYQEDHHRRKRFQEECLACSKVPIAYDEQPVPTRLSLSRPFGTMPLMPRPQR